MSAEQIKSILCLLLILHYVGSSAQSSQEINIDELRTPSSPGFILMDETPASIEKPTTPQGLAVNILSLNRGGAIEVSPAWLYNHRHLSFDDYVNEKFPIYKSASVSVATTRKEDSINLSFGVRTHLLRLRSRASQKNITTVKDRILNLLNEDEPNAAAIKNLKSQLDSAMRPTFILEFAAAYLGQSPDGSFSSLKHSRTGVWLNATFKPFTKFPFEIVALSRYVSNPYFGEYKKDAKIWDHGLRLLYSFEKIGLSAEYVSRKIEGDKTVDRLAGIFEYKFNDNIYATATFGQNFNEESDIIALFGINFGISSKTSVNP